MLRVNPERRADIDEIASHWWLNLDENMPVIQELPENQVSSFNRNCYILLYNYYIYKTIRVK